MGMGVGAAMGLQPGPPRKATADHCQRVPAWTGGLGRGPVQQPVWPPQALILMHDCRWSQSGNKGADTAVVPNRWPGLGSGANGALVRTSCGTGMH